MTEATQLVRDARDDDPTDDQPWLTGSWIQMYPSGKPFDLANPRAQDVDLEDIAHHLSLTCRFAGGVRAHYSVAQHSVLVAHLLADEGYGPEVQFKGLMHDTAEAYCQDLTRPLKALVAPLYAPIEARVMLAIGRRFDFDPAMPDAVKWADNVALFMERRDLKTPPPRPWTKEDEYARHMRAWAVDPLVPSKARDEFLHTFHVLNGAR